DLDSEKIEVNPQNDKNVDKVEKYGTLSWEDLDKIKPDEIASITVEKKDKDKTIFVIYYKDNRKNDTILKRETYNYPFDKNDSVISPRILEKKIREANKNNDSIRNLIRKLPQHEFIDPADYASYHKLLENWDTKKGKVEFMPRTQITPDLPKLIKVDTTAILLNGKDLREVESGVWISVDSISDKNKNMYFENGKALKLGNNAFSTFSDEMEVLPKNKKGSTVIAYQAGEKNENKIILNGKEFKSKNYFVENKKVTQKQFEKITKNNNYKISHIISDDAKMIKKYGKEISTSGIVLATKK